MAKIQLRRDTTANWNSVDPVLAGGEQGLNKDNGRIKIGDGSTKWSLLNYQSVEITESQISDLGTEIVTKTEIADVAGNITMNAGYF